MKCLNRDKTYTHSPTTKQTLLYIVNMSLNFIFFQIAYIIFLWLVLHVYNFPPHRLSLIIIIFFFLFSFHLYNKNTKLSAELNICCRDDDDISIYAYDDNIGWCGALQQFVSYLTWQERVKKYIQFRSKKANRRNDNRTPIKMHITQNRIISFHLS